MSAKASLVAVGTELTTGFVRDANLYYLAQRLDDMGIEVVTSEMIPDDRPLMLSVFEEAMRRSDLVIVTGGLGPTEDDFTKEVLLQRFGGEWCEDEATLEQIKRLLERRSLPLTTVNRQQAVVPSSAEVLPNAFGMAPGTLYRYDGGILVSLPGVPSEMRGIFETELVPRIAPLAGTVRHTQIYVFGVAESLLSDRLRGWSGALPEGLSLAYLPAMGTVCLRLSGDVSRCGEAVYAAKVSELRSFLEGDTTLMTDLSFPAYIVATLLQRGETLAIAESCTGGAVSGRITSVSGASKVYKGGVCTYTNEIKERVLGISHALLERHTAVSAPVVEAMAASVRELYGTNYGLATSGYMELDNAMPQQTGEVYIALATPTGVVSNHYLLNQNRQGNQEWSVERALRDLVVALLGD